MTDHAIQLVRNDLVRSITELASEIQVKRQASSLQTFFEARMIFISSQFKALQEMDRLKLTV